MNNAPSLRVVFDVNVYLDAILGADSTFPLIEEIPPMTDNAAMDCLSLAFDAEKFALFISPHILDNIARVLFEGNYTSEAIGMYLEALTEIVHFSGGSVVEPGRQVSDSEDFEDNLVLDLVKGVDALVLVTSDQGLLSLNPWRHRLVMSPADFVGRSL